MTLSANGDLTESFFHLSSDHSTDRLSSEDDVSIHTMDDAEAFLKLAKKHDMKMRYSVGKSDMSADDAFISDDSVHRIRNRKAGQVRRQLSDSVLEASSSQSTPLFNRRRFAQKQRKNMSIARESDDSFVPESNHDNDTTFDGKFDHYSGHNSTYDLEGDDSKVSRANLLSDSEEKPKADLQLLFKAFKPLIDQYIQQKLVSGNGTSHPQNASKELAPDSEPESAVDDTFDRPHRTHLRMDRTERGTPVTSPPQSSGDSQFRFDKSTEVDESDMCQQILLHGDENELKPITENLSNVDAKSKENDHHASTKQFTVTRREGPRVEVGDLTNDEIDLDFTHSFEDAEQARKMNESIETRESLQLKVEQYKKDNDGMSKEIKYLRCKLDALQNAALKQKGDTRTQQSQETSGNIQLQTDKENGPPSNIFEDNLPDQFRPFYQRLQLAKVDELSGEEKSYMIKNLMLSLLVSDFDHLSVMAPKVGAYLRVTTQFLDSLHEEIYPGQEMTPSQYLKNYNLDIDDEFQRCLCDMRKSFLSQNEPRTGH